MGSKRQLLLSSRSVPFRLVALPLLTKAAVVVFIFLSTVAASAATVVSECVWVFRAVEGKTTTDILEHQWSRDACAGGYVTVAAVGSPLEGFVIPNVHLSVLQYTPPTTGLQEGEVQYVSQKLSVSCNLFTPLCDKATAYYVVWGAENTTTAPTEEPTTTNAPSGELPVCPPPGVSRRVDVDPSVPVRLHPTHNVGNCVEPQKIDITSTSTSSITHSSGSTNWGANAYFSLGEDNTLWFDHNAENKESGVYMANLTVYCGGAASCFDVQEIVVVVNKSKQEDGVPNCNGTYEFEVKFMQHALLLITPYVEDTCPPGKKSVFTPVSPPKHNPEKFYLNETTGAFEYTGPEGPEIIVDTFVFVIGCIADERETISPMCSGKAQIRVTEDDKSFKEVMCPGNFVFNYDVNGCGDGSHTYNLISVAANDDSSFCPAGNYVGAQLLTQATKGNVTGLDKDNGSFRYLPFGGDVDHFGFALTCAEGSICVNNATMQPNEDCTPIGTDTVHDLGSIVCRGTCDAAAWRSYSEYPNVFDVTEGPHGGRTHVTPRLDGKSTDAMEFEIRGDGKSLLLRAYTTIGNMAARFVTFLPLENSSSPYLTSDNVPEGLNPSFHATCLNQQAKFGLASSIWTWDGDEDNNVNENKSDGKAPINGHLNQVSNAYKSGDNYFQKFGGKHRDCDVFRRDPCKYAPMLTPSSTNTVTNDGSTALPTIDWTLYINNCDATWVGNISLERLRQLRNPVTNAPLFTLVNNTVLVGTIYTQVVKPASWAPPYGGFLSLHRAYEVRLSIRSSILIDVEVEETGSVPPRSETTKIVNNAQISSSIGQTSADVRFAALTDPLTGERLYSYSILLFPYRLKSSSNTFNGLDLAYFNTTQLHVAALTLLNASWVVPNRYDCTQCTGKEVTCEGVGDGLTLNCDPIIRFELTETIPIFPPKSAVAAAGAGNGKGKEGEGDRFFNLSFITRVVGRNTTLSAPKEPQGTFFLSVKFDNGKTAVMKVEHFAYITGVNPRMPQKLCRSSAYWPVADPLGDSLPVKPFNASQLLHDFFSNPLDGESEKDKLGKYYGSPKALNKDAVCAANDGPMKPVRIVLNSTDDNPYDKGNKSEEMNGVLTEQLQLCASPDEKIYRATDWVYISLHNDMQQITEASFQHITLEYLILSVESGEVLNGFETDNAEKKKMVHFLLDGMSFPNVTGDSEFIMMDEEEQNKVERQKWMDEVEPSEAPRFLPWEKYAASLRYRRLEIRSCRVNKNTHNVVIEPFHFALIPGALLHRGSSPLVKFYLRAAVRFTSSQGKGESRVEKVFYTIPVSTYIPAKSSFAPEIVNPFFLPEKVDAVSAKSFSALSVFLVVAIFVLLIVVFRVETHYKTVLGPLRRSQGSQRATSVSHLAAANTSSNLNWGAEGECSIEETSTPVMINGATTSGIRTNYGVVQVERNRLADHEENSCNTSSQTPETSPLRVEQEGREERRQYSCNGGD